MTKREAERLAQQLNVLQQLGFTRDEADALRRISMRLHRWHERECGTDNGCIERDEGTGKAYWLNAASGKRYQVRDDEAGAKRRLAAILKTRNDRCYVQGTDYYGLTRDELQAFIQTDPRGAALYILRPGDVPAGESAEAYYNRGICVY